jgi:sugar/nucleoside kinase (ribokinase family)
MTIPAAPIVVALGEAVAEVMRPSVGLSLEQPGLFEGPFPSGAPAIFADAAARLGLDTGFIGCVGADAFGRAIKGRLARDGVNLACLRVDEARATGVAFVTYNSDGSRDFLFHLKQSAGAQAPALDTAYFGRVAYLHITGSTLALSPEWRAACLRAARLAKDAGALVAFDPNVRPELLGALSMEQACGPILELADVVLPSGSELAVLTGIAEPRSAVESLLARGVRQVIVKGGAQGSTLFSRDITLHVPAVPREERDPTGAGDAFAAGVAYGLVHGLSVEVMLRLANAVGGLAVTRLGPMEGLPDLAQAWKAAGLPEA